jgi:hypothetical protein
MRSVPASHLLKDFVDRTNELQKFLSLLDNRSGIQCLWGPGGIGKSTLIYRMADECNVRGIPWCLIEWRDSRRYSYLDFMRRIRDETSAESYSHFNDVVNFYTVPGYRLQLDVTGVMPEKVAVSTGNVSRSDVNVQVGHQIAVQDLHVSIQRPDQAASENTLMIEITSAFFRCFRQWLENNLYVLFCDAVEKADVQAQNWLESELLSRVRDGELPNVVTVVSGRQGINLDTSYHSVASQHLLAALATQHVLEYLQRKGLPADPFFAEFVTTEHQGSPLRIAAAINAFLEHRRVANV